jgi:hypothetical protein
MDDVFVLSVFVSIKKNGQPWYADVQESSGLSKEQIVDMEKDLLNLKIKWAKVSGISI